MAKFGQFTAAGESASLGHQSGRFRVSVAFSGNGEVRLQRRTPVVGSDAGEWRTVEKWVHGDQLAGSVEAIHDPASSPVPYRIYCEAVAAGERVDWWVA